MPIAREEGWIACLDKFCRFGLTTPDIRAESPEEYALAVMTAAVVVLVGVEQWIGLAMVVSLLRVIQHSYHPHSGVLIAAESGT